MFNFLKKLVKTNYFIQVVASYFFPLFFYLQNKQKIKIYYEQGFWIHENFYGNFASTNPTRKAEKYHLILKALMSEELKSLNIKFSLAGSGKDLRNFQNKIKKYNLSKKISVENYLSHLKLKKWYNSLDLYVHASLYEGMSISILQAMYMKLPTIGSHVSDIKNILATKKFLGKTFKNKIKDLSKNIKYFYFLNKETRKKYIDTQYNYLTLNNSSKVIFIKYEKLIKKL